MGQALFTKVAEEKSIDSHLTFAIDRALILLSSSAAFQALPEGKTCQLNKLLVLKLSKGIREYRERVEQSRLRSGAYLAT